jgi:hypothetical protein
MDIQQNLISTAISAGVYILYKIVQRYYVRSGCYNNRIEIAIIDKEEKEEKKEKKEEITIEI